MLKNVRPLNLDFLSVRKRHAAVPEPGKAAVSQTQRSKSQPLYPGGWGCDFSVSYSIQYPTMNRHS